MAQLGARFHGMEEVVGSNPTRSTKSFLDFPLRSGFRLCRAQTRAMYIVMAFMYIECYAGSGSKTPMATARNRAHKHFQLDAVKIKRAQRVLRAKTETEAVERALDLAIAEHERNRLAFEANERFVKSGIGIKDVYETLGG